MHTFRIVAGPAQALKKSRDQPGRKGPTVISKRYRSIGQPEYDVCVAGGTLGIFIALALQVSWSNTVPESSACIDR